MKEKLKQIWHWLNNKKTLIGAGIMLVSQGLRAFVPDALTHEQYEFAQNVGLFITTGGFVHKGLKTGEKVMKNIKNKKDGRN